LAGAALLLPATDLAEATLPAGAADLVEAARAALGLVATGLPALAGAATHTNEGSFDLEADGQ
jgi:hypothetical protein